MRKHHTLAAFLGLLLAGLSASVAFGQELHWAKRAGGIERDNAWEIAVDAAGNSYVAGNFEGVATFGSGENNQTILDSGGDVNVFVAKYDGAGTLIWARRVGPVYYGVGLAVDNAGNSYVTGSFYGPTTFGAGETNETTLTTAGGYDIFVAKYNSGGALVWAKRAGGTYEEEGSAIAVDESGNSFVTGVFGYSEFPGGTGTATFGAGEVNQTVLGQGGLFLAKYDSAGALVWAKRAGTGNHSFGIAVDTAGNSYVTGDFEGGATFGPGEANQTSLTSEDNVVFVAKYNSVGGLLWVRQAGTYALGLDVAVDGIGNSYVTGLFGGSGFFRGTAPFGVGEVNQTILFGAGNGDMFVAKYDSAGALVWAKRAGGSEGDGGSGIAVDGVGNSYVSGSFGGTATFGPEEANQTILSSAGNGDMFVAKYDSVGALVWAKRAGGTEGDSGNGIAVDGVGNSYVTGSFGGTAPFGQTVLTSAGNGDMFVAKMGVQPLGPPVVLPNSVVNAASFVAGAPVASGSIAAVFGSNLASAVSGGVGVRLGSTPAFLFYVSPTQINFQVPWEVSGQTQASLTVTVDGVASSPVTVNLAAFSPGIFRIGPSGQGAILIASTGEVAAPVGSVPGRASRPANRGVDFISIYCTGLGDVTNRPVSGTVASSNPLSSTTATPSVTVGGVATAVEFSGLTPILVGLYQINVLVPSNAPTGAAVPVVVSIGGTSHTATIAVQ